MANSLDGAMGNGIVLFTVILGGFMSGLDNLKTDDRLTRALRWANGDKSAMVAEDAILVLATRARHSRILLHILKLAHSCATVRDDGSCGGCYISDAISAYEKEAS